MYQHKFISRLARRCAATVIGLATMMAVGVLANPAQADEWKPTADFTATALPGGGVQLEGWAYESYDMNRKLTVSFSLNGQYFAATVANEPNAEQAAQGRPDIGFTLNQRIPDGDHVICLFVEKISPYTYPNVPVKCAEVTTYSESPRGVFERAYSGGQVTGFRGWVIDDSDLNHSVDLFLTHNGNIVAMQRADRPSPELAPYGIPGNHGFYFPMTGPMQDEYCVFAVNVGDGDHQTIGCLDMT